MAGPSFAHDSDRLARDYEQVSAARQFESGKRLVMALAVADGGQVLDVGCGTGQLAGHVAGLVGPRGRVLGIDPLVARIELARQRLGQDPPANLAFEVGDANDLAALAPASFDVVLLNAVFHWLPDKRRPLAEFARVLRPGGRLGLSTRPPAPPTLLQRIRNQVLAEPPFAAHPGRRGDALFRIGPDETRALLEEAGFGAIEIALEPVEQHFDDAAAAIRFSEASSFGNFLGHLPDDLRDRARAEIGRRLDAARAGHPILRDGQRMVVTAARV
ncbi:MAG: class I SAM-dependent methyltransferase [Enhydrobacter sp.]|nr:MAG: class I SAM-dependent methyltransferase [Enhydrobacter sp.]